MADHTSYRQFAANMLHPDSVYIPKILKSMIDDGQADLLVALPGTVSDLASRTQRPEREIEKDLEDMFRKGLAFKKEKPGQPVSWRAPLHIAQFHDASIVWPEATSEFLRCWESYMEKEWPALAPLLAGFLPKPYTRVIPVEHSLEPVKARVLTSESLREIIDGAEKIAVTKCTCRLSMHKCDAPIEVCLQVGRGAEYTIERGSGHEISKREAHKIINTCAEAGLVHVTMNTSDVTHFICNCCGCCCQSFSMMISDGVNLCDPSRYKAHVDADACTGCGTCMERCHFNAITIPEGCAATVDLDICMGCGQCAVGCPEEAMSMTEVKTPDFIPG
ncbi:4Fe-4S binding protein [Desulfoluna spongiiphila]|uniref:4Fe-4S binding domain-containing protein n=1 Tax=Desulfoluna spongiiphila TaxID=419481 RepID=A0A1G5ID66_9BACT|nr:4Fe-4S binding protein [Desulfoluna spongiiphila]SCY73944.1 4Fe-4S binding domain-containing protein [Desulfoluna spongiiphila]